MPITRMRMRPWLEMQINSNEIPGLIWINKEEMIFQIPWKHAAKHGWDINKDACLFRSWAIHTGRYKAGEKEPDPKTWKANFRCAMNSLPDIEEVKDQSRNKGSSAVRVYRMLPPLTKNQRKGMQGLWVLRKPSGREGEGANWGWHACAKANDLSSPQRESPSPAEMLRARPRGSHVGTPAPIPSPMASAAPPCLMTTAATQLRATWGRTWRLRGPLLQHCHHTLSVALSLTGTSQWKLCQIAPVTFTTSKCHLCPPPLKLQQTRTRKGSCQRTS